MQKHCHGLVGSALQWNTRYSIYIIFAPTKTMTDAQYVRRRNLIGLALHAAGLLCPVTEVTWG